MAASLPPSSPASRALLAWLAEEGAEFSAIQLVEEPQTPIALLPFLNVGSASAPVAKKRRLGLHTGGSMGDNHSDGPDRSLVAAAKIAAGDSVCSVPVSVLLHAGSSPELPRLVGVGDSQAKAFVQRHGEERVATIARIARERGAGSASRWAPYLNAISKCGAAWAAEGTSNLYRGTPLASAIERMQAEVAGLEVGLTALAIKEGPPWAGLVTPATVRWAAVVFFSRAMMLPTPMGQVECLAPLLDLANHRPGTLLDATSTGSTVELRTGTMVQAGGRVMNNYGAKSNANLALNYGFVIGGNPCDVLDYDGIVLERKAVRSSLAPPVELLEAARADTAPAGGGVAAAAEDVYDMPPKPDWTDPRTYTADLVTVGDLGQVREQLHERKALAAARLKLESWRKAADAAPSLTVVAAFERFHSELARAYRKEVVGLVQEHLDGLCALEKLLKPTPP